MALMATHVASIFQCSDICARKNGQFDTPRSSEPAFCAPLSPIPQFRLRHRQRGNGGHVPHGADRRVGQHQQPAAEGGLRNRQTLRLARHGAFDRSAASSSFKQNDMGCPSWMQPGHHELTIQEGRAVPYVPSHWPPKAGNPVMTFP